MDTRSANFPSAPRDSILSGSAGTYFGKGFESMQLVQKESQKRGYKPWVVPGGLLSPSYIIIPSSPTAFQILNKCTHKGHVPSKLYYPGTPRTIVTSEGTEWKQRRSAVSPVFAHSNVKGAVTLIDTVVQTAVEYLKTQVGKQVDSNELCGRICLDIIGYVVYGESFNSVPDPKHPAAFAAHQLSIFSGKNFASPIRRYLRLGKKEYDEAISVFDSVAEQQLRKVPSAQTNAATVLHLLQNATKDDGTKEWADTNQYLEELRLVVNASHDPAIPMSFALFEVSRNPEIAARVKREIASVLGDRREISYDDLANLEYTTAIFKEALRMWPVAGIGIGRMIENEMEIAGGARLPAGQMILIPFYTVMRSPQEWDEPDTFRPERFLSSETPKAQANSDRLMLAFSAGLRMCPGFQLALYEGTVTLAHLLRNFDFSFKKGEPTLECGIHVMPKDLMMGVSLAKAN